MFGPQCFRSPLVLGFWRHKIPLYISCASSKLKKLSQTKKEEKTREIPQDLERERQAKSSKAVRRDMHLSKEQKVDKREEVRE